MTSDEDMSVSSASSIESVSRDEDMELSSTRFSSNSSINDSNREDTMSDSGNSEFSGSDSSREHLPCCKNCHREQQRLMNDTRSLHLNLRIEPITFTRSDKSKFLRKFNNLQFSSLFGRNVQEVSVDLCYQCKNYILSSSRKASYVDCWPSMIWQWLTARDIQEAHGLIIWNLIPYEWKLWWYNELSNIVDVNINVESLTFDVTQRKNTLEHAIKKKELKPMMDAVNDHLLFCVKCPWGCSECFHKTGSLPMDVVVARLFGAKLFAKKSVTANLAQQVSKKVAGIRDDYLQTTPDDCVLCNPRWMIVPSIAFLDDGAPYVLTCRFHRTGSSSIYIHPPKNPVGNISSRCANQLAPAVISTRTTKTMKPHIYSNSYQMQEMRSQYNGVDTVNLKPQGKFDVPCEIARQQDLITIGSRPDIQAFVSSANRQGEHPLAYVDVDALRKNARQACESRQEDVEKCLLGSTFVTVSDALKLQVSMKTESSHFINVRYKVQQICGVNADCTNGETILYQPYWPTHVVNFHPYNSYGATPVAIKHIVTKERDFRLLWMVASLHSTVDSVWESTVRSIQSNNQWMGWMLMWITWKVFPGKAGRKGRLKNPFPVKKSTTALEQEVIAHFDSSIYGDSEVDEIFSIDGMSTLFQDHRDVKVQNRSECDFSTWDDDVQIVIIVNNLKLADDERFNLRQFGADESVWKARFVAFSDDGGSLQWNAWRSTLFVRHGDDHFSNWWQNSYKSVEFEKVLDFDAQTARSDWDFVVFTKKTTPSLETMKEQFLISIGGQAQVYCEEHNLPLITACYTTETACSTNCNCRRKVKFQCPNIGCQTAICSLHQKMCVAQNCKHCDDVVVDDAAHVANNDVDDDESSTGSNPAPVDEEEECGSTDSNRAPVDDVEERGSDFNGNEDEGEDFLPAEGNDGDDNSDCGQSEIVDDEGSELDVDFAYHHIVEGDDPMLVDESVDGEEDEVENEDVEVFVPTTNAGGQVKRVDKCNIARFLPLHVILNNCGSLLARKTKLKGTTMQQNTVQGFVASLYGKSIPLLFPEGMLFPSIFWKELQMSIIGAIPCGMLTSNHQLKKLGVATLKSHFLARLMNGTLLTSTDEKYISYAFDCLVNLGCRTSDTRLLLNRVLKFTDLGIAPSLTDGKLYDCECIDSRPIVNKLAAAMRTNQATYFYTHTCNQSEHFGVCNIKRWIDSPELAEILLEKMRMTEPDVAFYGKKKMLAEMILCVARSAGVTMLRHWMEVSEIWMMYIAESPEQPLGKIVNMWVRHEYQDGEGNLSHLHGLLWVDKSTGVDQETLQKKIKGSVLELLSDDDIEKLQRQGVINEKNTVDDILRYAKKVLTHKCNKRCQVLRQRGDHTITTMCRVVNNGLVNKQPRDHSMQEINVKHSDMACKILQELGLFDLDSEGNWIVKDEKLLATKHIPPSYSHEGAISQCNALLFAATLSSQNLQLITGYLASRYLAKYVAQVDENNRIRFGSGQVDDNSLKADYNYLHNTKIAGSKATLDILGKKRRDAKHPTGRAISLMEILSIMFNYAQVVTDLKFFHIASSPLEERAGFMKQTQVAKDVNNELLPREYLRIHNPPDLHTSTCLPSVHVRNSVHAASMPKWRKISRSEEITLKDQLLSDITTDATTIFSMRPPELRWVRLQELYHKWFYREPSRRPFKNSVDLFKFAEDSINVDLRESWWMDGFLHRIFVRPCAIDEVYEYLLTGDVTNDDFYSDDVDDQPTDRVLDRENPLYHMKALFYQLKRRSVPRRGAARNLGDDYYRPLKERLIGPAEKTENNIIPIIWHNSVRPSNGHRWMIHILLTMGKFDNELNLLSKRSMRDSFIHAKLMRQDPEHWEEDVNIILKNYVQSQLIHIPGGSQSFDWYLITAKQTLSSMLLNNALPMYEMPPCLLSRLRESHAEQYVDFARDQQMKLVTATLLHLEKKNVSGTPQLNDFLDDAPIPHERKFNWETLQSSSNQDPTSVTEQKATLKLIMDRINMYSDCVTEQTKSIIILGGPGVGKTTVLQMALLQALQEKSFNVALTALMSERANQLGGEHISKLFGIPAKSNVPAHRLAELALIQLMRKPKRWMFLKNLDILFIDEFGQISAELLSTLDIILRDIKSSSLFLGGVVTFSTMDPLQLRPIDGRPPLTSSHISSCFDIYKLNVSVRAASDPILQEIQSITRSSVPELMQNDSFLLNRFKDLVRNNCTFVESFDDRRLEQHLLRVFGKKRAARQAEATFLSQMKCKYGDEMISVSSQDQESSFDGIWRDVTPLVKIALNDHVKEPERLFFFPFAVYEITFNKENCYSQSQIAILAEVPSREQIMNFEPVSVYVAPPGIKFCTAEMIANHDYAAYGWKLARVPVAPDHVHVIHRNIFAKRRQYGLRHRIASTIHASMGQDLLGIVTKISNDDPQYKLWEKEQVVVLLSRTHFCRDICFVGDVDETTNALASLLLRRSLYSDYLDYILMNMVNDPQQQQNAARQLNWSRHPFRPKDITIPTDNMGFVYLLISLQAPEVTYIGSTNSLTRRLRQHNSGLGSYSTRDVLLRPWALVAFVCGFHGSDLFRQRQNFERTWKVRVRSREDNTRQPASPQEIITIGQELILTWTFGDTESNLIFVHCGTLQ